MKYFLSLVLALLFGCSISKIENKSVGETYAEKQQQDISTIAFGSCNKTDLPQILWTPILNNNPDLWIWLGDIVYADSNDPKVIELEYSKQKAVAEYQLLEKNCPVIGIWDDHDYGKNDGGKDFKIKAESRDLLFDFLNIPDDAQERKRRGGYYTKTFGEEGREVKVILLDCRYFRDNLKKDLTGKKRYQVNKEGDILGEEQWIWLEKELSESTAHFNIIGSGIQVIPEEHRYEKWANFPTARKRLFDLLKKTKPSNAVFISGDRHIAEISKTESEEIPYTIFDITSSGMTHSYEAIKEKGETNKFRIPGKLTGEKNFGVFIIDWKATPPEMKVQIRGVENKLIFEEDIF